MPISIFLDSLLAARYHKDGIKNEALHRQTGTAPTILSKKYAA